MLSPISLLKAFKLYVNESCEVALDDFGSHTQCTLPTSSSSSTERIVGEDSSSDSSPYIGGIVGAIGAAVVIVIIVLVIVIAIVLIRKTGKRK